MNQEITIALIGISSALLGTFAGGFISYYSSKSLKILELNHKILGEEIRTRRELYSQFLAEANLLIYKVAQT